MKKEINILFVCLGNICRSPMAEFLMREKINQAGLTDKIKTSSAGTSGWHDGEDMHCGTADMLDQHKINSSSFRSKKVRSKDWEFYDYLIAMDDQNLQDLEEMFGHHPEKLFKITTLCPDIEYDHIPDPWYTKDFNQTYQLLDRCCDVLLNKIKQDFSL